jgi:hypothetical protein
MKTTRLKPLLLAGLMVTFAGLAGASSFTFTGNNYGPSASSIPSQTVGGVSTVETGFWANVDNSGASLIGGSNDFAAANIAEYSGAGLGICNPSEQAAACVSPQHQIDNYQGLDFVNFSFSTAVTLSDVYVVGFGNPTGTGWNDVDLSYAVLSSTQEAALNAGTLAFSSVNFTTMSTNFYGYNDYTLAGTGQYLLVGAAVTPYYGDGSASQATPDAFKIQTLSVISAAPEPASFLLIGVGLLAGGLFGRRRMSKRAI